MAELKTKHALLSVYDKTDVVWLGNQLQELGYKILATGGTAKILQQNGIELKEISSFTKEPEMFAGRVKTLHPKVFGGILYNRDKAEDCDDSREHSIPPIDVVVVNFYPFESEALQKKLPLEKAIEFVDIGGPSMLRAAAKNWKHSIPVASPEDYKTLVAALKEGQVSDALRQDFAAKTFKYVLDYDRMISDYFAQNKKEFAVEKQQLRYGENPGQEATLTRTTDSVQFKSLHGKELSYNNILDLDSGLSLIKDFGQQPAFVILKHTNPCGAAWGSEPAAQLFLRAQASDPLSAFGGIVVSNQTIDLDTAKALNESFFECVVAPAFTEDAMPLLQSKKNRRLIQVDFATLKDKDMIRSTHLGVLQQVAYPELVPTTEWVHKAGPTLNDEEQSELSAALRIGKHIKSNGIAFSQKGQSVGVACGHVSRVDALKHAIGKAIEFGHSLEGAYLASDAFFPFRDCVDLAAKHNIKAIIQPGGSIRDTESIEACEEHGISLYFCGTRYFKH